MQNTSKNAVVNILTRKSLNWFIVHTAKSQIPRKPRILESNLN